MKIFAICGLVGAVVLFGMVQQLGLLDSSQHSPGEPAPEVIVEKKPSKPRATFPEDLVPGVQGQAVPVAAAFEPGEGPHTLAFLKSTGAIHPWQESVAKYHEDWCAETVEKTELLVIVGGNRKTILSHHKYPNGAPPITRYRYDLEVSIAEARTGKVIANREFQNIARGIRPRESWETTALGEPVSYRAVFRWVSRIAKFGPPALPEPPHVAIVGD